MSQNQQLTRLQHLLENLPDVVPYHDTQSTSYRFSVSGEDITDLSPVSDLDDDIDLESPLLQGMLSDMQTSTQEGETTPAGTAGSVDVGMRKFRAPLPHSFLTVNKSTPVIICIYSSG